MKHPKRWNFAQADDHYSDHAIQYLFLHNFTKISKSIVWDFRGGEWVLDGVGHSNFQLELVW